MLVFGYFPVRPRERSRGALALRVAAGGAASELSARAGRAENDTPKTAFEVRVELRRIKAAPILMAQVITYIKSLYLDVRLVLRLRARAPVVRRSVDSKIN